jgi:hypothetical protein
MTDCKDPAHLSENEKYQIIAEIVFNMISDRAIAHMRKYLEADYKYHIMNQINPLIEASLKRREEIAEDFLNNNSIDVLVKRVQELKYEAQELYHDMNEKKELFKQNQLKALREVIDYYLEHECDEDYN